MEWIDKNEGFPECKDTVFFLRSLTCARKKGGADSFSLGSQTLLCSPRQAGLGSSEGSVFLEVLVLLDHLGILERLAPPRSPLTSNL